MSQFLSPRQFAEAIGVSESSVRRWADRGDISIARTAGGHRKIAHSEAIRFIREHSAEVVRPDLLEISEPTHRRARTAAFAEQHAELLEAMLAGHAEVAISMLTRMYVNGVTAAQICDGPLRHAMQVIGNLWPEDKRGIFLEHRATNICLDGLSALRSQFTKRSEKAPIAVGGSPEADPYAVPTLMVSTVLADVGFSTVNLGPNTPLEVLSQSAAELQARVAWLSVSMQQTASFQGQFDRLVQRLQRRQVYLFIGGQGVSQLTLTKSKYLRCFASLEEMSLAARSFLA